MTTAVWRKDVIALWCSPIPYVVGSLFNAVVGLLYVSQLEARQQAVIQPLFPLAGFLLIAMVPILTMRSFADEIRTGTLDLLQAVPVRARPLVVGKWLAVWMTSVAVLAPTALFVLLLSWWGDPDYGPIASGFLGLVLLAAAASAVGVLASATTASQPVAAMVTLFASLLLWFSSVGAETTALGRVLVQFSFSERLRALAGGVIDTADVGFFVLLVAGALTGAALVVDGRRLR